MAKTNDEIKRKVKQNEGNSKFKDKKSKKKIKNVKITEKMKHFNGKAYENYSCYKLCHKIFLEDITKIN